MPAEANDNAVSTAATLTRAQAATFCGISPSRFSVWVNLGIVPAPIPGTRRWSKKQVVAAIEQDNRKLEERSDGADAALERWLASGA